MINLIDNIIDRLPPERIAGLVKNSHKSLHIWKRDTAFKRIIKYSYKKSKFYKRKFDELGINPDKVNCPEDLADFYTTTEDIIANPYDFLCSPADIVFESSGTSGINKKIFLSSKDLRHIAHMIATGYFLFGINAKSDRVANAFDFSLWIPGLINQLALLDYGVFNMAFGKVDPIELYNRMEYYKFNVILGEPTWLIRLTEIAEKKGSFPVKFFIGGAEEMPASAYKWISSIWQGAKVRMVYASVESGGVLGYQASDICKAYHVDDADFWVEIIDKDEEGYGEICFTTLSRFAMPLVRYRNKDISKFIMGPCSCGIPSVRLEKIKGRRDEIVVASGGNLYPLMFERILTDTSHITNDWQIVFKLDGIREVMEFNLETEQNGKREEITNHIFDQIKILYPDLWKNYCLNTFKITFNFHQPSTLRKARKIKRLVDIRHSPETTY